jgi:hypothetical protein
VLPEASQQWSLMSLFIFPSFFSQEGTEKLVHRSLRVVTKVFHPGTDIVTLQRSSRCSVPKKLDSSSESLPVLVKIRCTASSSPFCGHAHRRCCRDREPSVSLVSLQSADDRAQHAARIDWRHEPRLRPVPVIPIRPGDVCSPVRRRT